MAPRLPDPLARLLNGADPAGQGHAWEDFLDEYSPLLLRVARSVTRDHDEAMDAYAFVLEGLRQDDLRRLRVFSADGKSRFTTWLVVVAKRLCHDHHRARYGQSRGGTRSQSFNTRARLVDLVSVELDIGRLPAGGRSPEAELRSQELRDVLKKVLKGLASEDRLLLARRFEDGLPIREIGELMGGSSVFHVYRQLNRVLKTVREVLIQSGVDGPTP